MNDKSIRQILISYLKSVNDEIRIYQEKSVGSSICDVMAVTDELTGYEIKSDLDNYSRLDMQIRAYNMFFDRNYIVVSHKHIKSINEKIPAEWGIIYILDNKIVIERIAKPNPKVSRRRQLSILWKLELKNLLIKNNLPLYAQKEKGYIADRIAASVNNDLLGEQIARELMERDYSVYDAEDYTIKSNKSVTDIPEAELIDRLSEEDLGQFTLDKWIDIYSKAKTVKEKKNIVYKKKKAERVPHEIPYTDIEVSLGAPWISAAIISDFADHIIDCDNSWVDRRNLVKYEQVTSSWFVSDKKHYSTSSVTARFGTSRYTALQILEATLNLREIKIHDTDGYNVKYNEVETIAVLEKQQLLIEEFKKWVWLDEDRRWEIEETYNRMFAEFKPRIFDGSSLEFPDMNKDFTLFDYQKDAVQKIISTPNTLLAFDVGAGKTFIMIAAAMELRKRNISRKNMFVVPNNIVGQWEKIFTDLYPQAKLLTVEPKTFKPEMRQKVLGQIQRGDYDGIIIAYSCFEMIPLSEQFVLYEMEKKINIINSALNDLKNSYSWKWGSTPLEQEKNYIKKITSEFLDSFDVTTEEITFDSLEINTLFLDEAHNYKNLPLKTKLKNINGINTKGSMKCMDMMQKIRCVQINNGGRGAVLATGTPLCNSISDTYAMQMYLQPEKMAELGLDKFDNWVKTFARPEQICEIDVDTSKFRFIHRFAKFFNLPELSRMFSDVAIFHAVNSSDGLPDFDDYTDVVIEKSAQLDEYMKLLCERTEAIRMQEIDSHQDNMLKVSTDGRKAALSLELVGKEQPYDKHSKIFNCVENVIKIYKDSSEYTQLIFCDYSTPKGDDFSLYKELKTRLKEKGVPEKEIAFIHSYKTESTKLKLFEDFNSGKIRVLIGSTFKLGIGANVQTKLKAIHHLDVPWRPADMIQREGRILRRGNLNKDVFIYRYITQGSFDSYSWQILETKQKFISQFLNGSSYQRTASDLENNVLTYAQVKALALSQPLMKKLAEKENELRNVKILQMQNEQSTVKYEEELNEAKYQLDLLKDRMSAAKSISKHLAECKPSAYKQASEYHKGIITRDLLFSSDGKTEIVYLNLYFVIPKNQDEKKPVVYLTWGDEKFTVEMGNSPEGNIRRLTNYLKSFDKVVTKTQNLLNEYEAKIADIEKFLSEHSDYHAQIKKLEIERDEIMQALSDAEKIYEPETIIY